MPKRKWTQEQLEIAVKESTCLKQVLEKLNLAISGSMFSIIKTEISKLELNTLHWSRNSNPSRIQFGNNAPIETIFITNSPWSKQYIRRRIIKESLIPYDCSICHITSWNNKKITLQLDHINGNTKDNRLENLRFLCPNCHSQTETWGTKTRILQEKLCESCGQKISNKSHLCRKCAGFLSPSKINWPSIDELIKMVEETSYLAVGKIFGVSDNAVRKHILKRINHLPK